MPAGPPRATYEGANHTRPGVWDEVDVLAAMSLETLNTVAAVGTFLVIATTALAALVQLRHLRRGNWLAAQLTILEMWNSETIQGPYNYIKTELPEKMKDAAYRRELEYGPIDRSIHREMVMIDWNAHLGLLLEERLLDESFLKFYRPAVLISWQTLSPVLAILRRQRDSEAIQHLDYLFARAEQLEARPKKSIFTDGLKRPPLVDVWRPFDHPDADVA